MSVHETIYNEVQQKMANVKLHESVSYKRIDRRRKKEYGATLTYTLAASDAPFIDRRDFFTFLEGIEATTPFAVGFSWMADYGSLTFQTEVPKPSLIPSEEEMRKSTEQFFTAFKKKAEQLFERTFQERFTEIHQQQAAVAANDAFNFFQKEVEERAKKAMRLKQRLAALRAEYEAECQAQIEAIKEKKHTYPDGSAVPDETLNLAFAELEKVKFTPFTHPFFKTDLSPVKAKDIKL